MSRPSPHVRVCDIAHGVIRRRYEIIGAENQYGMRVERRHSEWRQRII